MAINASVIDPETIRKEGYGELVEYKGKGPPGRYGRTYREAKRGIIKILRTPKQ